jgi:septal ring factor EnvC (AmiA/AmiB activator)
MYSLLYKIGIPIVALGLLIGVIHHYVKLTYMLQQANQQIAQLQSDKANQAKQYSALEITNQSLQEDAQHAKEDAINANTNVNELNRRLQHYTHNNTCMPQIAHNSNTKHIASPNSTDALTAYVNTLYKAGESCRYYYNRLYSACDKYSEIVKIVNK